MDTQNMTPAQKDRLLNSFRFGKLMRPVASEDAVIMRDGQGNETELTACAADFKKEAPKARKPAKQIERDPEAKAEARERGEDGKEAAKKAAESAARQLERYKQGNDLVDAWTVTEHRLAKPDNTPTK